MFSSLDKFLIKFLKLLLGNNRINQTQFLVIMVFNNNRDRLIKGFKVTISSKQTRANNPSQGKQTRGQTKLPQAQTCLANNSMPRRLKAQARTASSLCNTIIKESNSLCSNSHCSSSSSFSSQHSNSISSLLTNLCKLSSNSNLVGNRSISLR